MTSDQRTDASRRARRIAARASPRAAQRGSAKPARKAGGKAGGGSGAEPVLFRFCKPGWAVLVEKQPSQQGTRFVCPFCTQSHRVSGPVRGFRKMRRAQWIKLRRVDE